MIEPPESGRQSLRGPFGIPYFSGPYRHETPVVYVSLPVVNLSRNVKLPVDDAPRRT